MVGWKPGYSGLYIYMILRALASGGKYQLIVYHSLIIRVKHQDLLSDTTTFIQIRTYSQTGQQSKFIPLFNTFASIFVLKPNQKWWGIATPVLTFLEKCQLTTRLLVALHEPGQACFLILWLLVFLHSSMMIRILISSAPNINLGMLPSVLCLFFQMLW